MQYWKVVFSPTGGTQAVADAVTSEWPEPSSMVDLTAREQTATRFTDDDLVLIAVPSYGGRVPALAAERLSALKGNGAKAVLVCVYGNRAYDDTLVEMEDLARECGFRVIAAVAAVAEHSIMRQYASGRPDEEDRKELAQFGQIVADKAANGWGDEAELPGHRPYKKSGSLPIVPKAGKNCTDCGTCAQECPAGAIDPGNPRDTDSDVCITCMRCVSVCPSSARHVNRAVLTAASLALKKAVSGHKPNELFS